MLPTQVQYWSYKETQRHNIATEKIAADTLTETRRHNVRSEDLGFKTLSETVRHNKVTEAQTNWYNAELGRHNLAMEGIGRTQAQSSMIQAHASTMSASANLGNMITNSYLSTYTAKNLKAQTTKMQSETARGWFDSLTSTFSLGKLLK